MPCRLREASIKRRRKKSSTLKNVKVLIVEDDPVSQRLLRLVLSLAGAQDVREVGDAETAIRLLESFTPDLVLIDLVLPDVGGIELIGKLRDRDRGPTVYIAVTAFTLPGIEADALDLGFHAFIEKPFNVETIAEDIAEVLRGARRRQASQPAGANRKGGTLQ